MSRFLLRCCAVAVFPLLLACVLLGQGWKTAETLPGNDLSGLNATQKATALKILRERDCSCGCGRKVAQCRIEDTSCAYSRGLAAEVIAALQQGKSEADAIAAADASRYAHIQQPKLLEDPVSIPVAGAPWTGNQNAPVTLVEFSDFQCPYCATAAPQIMALVKAYPKEIKLIFKEFPLEMHPQADLAAAAAVAAQKQGKFWEMHDAMFANRNNLSRANLLALAKDNGLNVEQFESDVDSTAVRETVVRDVQDGDKVGVEGTPTLFINGQHYNGPLDAHYLKQILDAELKKPAGQTASARP